MTRDGHLRIACIGAKGLPATVGGVERHVEELAVRLADEGHAVTVYSRPWYTGHVPWSVRRHHGVRVVTVPSLVTKHTDAFSHTLLATLHALRERFDVYHFHGVGPSLLAFLPRVLHPRARVVVTFHCVDRHHEKWGLIARWVLAVGEWTACRFPHETIAVSRGLATYCRERYGRAAACIPNGVATAQPPQADDRASLAQIGLTPRRYFLVVSRLVPHKGIHDTITAFRRVRREDPACAGLTLVVVGGSSFTDGYRDTLEVLAGGDPSIMFLGPRSGRLLACLYRHALAFVHASSSEGLPIVLLEAAASGCLPIVSNIPEHREVIDRIGGMCFRYGDVDDLAVKLAVAVYASPSLPSIGEAIRASVRRSHDWAALARATTTLYRRTLVV